ncbi:ABC transporter permease [Cloacibacillus sp. An23]|uniref:ABC transporter permease n=1 Tax=Cloacibacillus sp. An23 TaxID=1965591 RepID=UPI000B385E15|nr:ABC transporter permease [Cloacibacillus sp. An23]OUO95127.1 peptide ABC transporter permease [Cloacibacillus sp. An23]
MKDILSRKSVIAFILLALLGVFGPALLPRSPYEFAGAPFARPVWWRSGTLPANVSYEINSAETSITWDKNPPAIFSLSGKIKASPESRVTVTWRTPERKFLLAELSGESEYWLNLDGRDMIFKHALGLPLISRSVDYLFPRAGVYELRVEGAGEDISLRLSLPGERCGLLGTDQRGRDVFTLLIYGIRASLIIGVSATLIASLLGMSLGLAAGYAGGLCDALIMRAVDILMSIPTLPILMVLAGIWGKGLWQLVLILSIFSWMGTARSVRALVLTLRESQWVESLRALGAKRSYILARHLVPETAPVLLANIALGVPGAILAEAGLAFLGLSDPRLISWGRMLHEAHSFGAFTEGAWWLLLPPGLGIVAVCLIFMDIGKFLEEKIDPRLGKK